MKSIKHQKELRLQIMKTINRTNVSVTIKNQCSVVPHQTQLSLSLRRSAGRLCDASGIRCYTLGEQGGDFALQKAFNLLSVFAMIRSQQLQGFLPFLGFIQGATSLSDLRFFQVLFRDGASFFFNCRAFEQGYYKNIHMNSDIFQVL